MRRWLTVGVAVILVAAVAVGGWRQRSRARPASPASTTDAAQRDTRQATVTTASGDSPSRGIPEPARAGRVRRVQAAERLELASRIAAARARRAAAVVPEGADPSPGIADDDPMRTAEGVLTELQAVMPEIRAHVDVCRAEHAPLVLVFKARLALVGDPDVGTLVDASALEGVDGASLPAAFDECVRARMQELELAPLHTGDRFSASLTFDLGQLDPPRADE